MSGVYFERKVFSELKLGLDELLSPGYDAMKAREVLTAWARSVGLEDDDEIRAMVSLLTSDQAKQPQVRHGYARIDQTLPAFNIVLGNEQESNLVIGGVGGPAEGGAERFVSDWSRTINVQVISTHPDVTLWLYHVAKYVLTSRRRRLEAAANPYSMTFAGSEPSPMETYLPEHMFMRVLTISMASPEEVVGVPQPDTLIREVRGPYVPVESEGVDGGVVPVVGGS